MKAERLGRLWHTAQERDAEVMKRREMAVEAAGMRTQWETATRDATRRVRDVEEQLRVVEAEREKAREESIRKRERKEQEERERLAALAFGGSQVEDQGAEDAAW
ncbi:hypothetical protein EJ03DRAFT_61460 [Teratosphaeria nubilosa]|uniref:Uncharacterized protein n=1 Tax=Teratosphaeria nubilosa TaxID=161662 RepID=A0A6G1LCL6_9PEZI|nr:hypothetical protein EJ03DRAFT_61460 [Teratosphaeria nubilosa]